MGVVCHTDVLKETPDKFPTNIIIYEFSGLQSWCCSNDNLLGYHTTQVDMGVSDEFTTSILIISNLNTDEVSA